MDNKLSEHDTSCWAASNEERKWMIKTHSWALKKHQNNFQGNVGLIA